MRATHVTVLVSVLLLATASPAWAAPAEAKPAQGEPDAVSRALEQGGQAAVAELGRLFRAAESAAEISFTADTGSAEAESSR